MLSNSRQQIDFSLCANCSQIGSIDEIDINSGGTDFRVTILKTKVVDALEFLYGISWVDFTEKYRKYSKSGNNDSFGVTDSELVNNVILCTTCAPLVAENYRFQKNLESLSHSKSLLQLAKRLCGCRPPANNSVDPWQNSTDENETFEDLIVVNQDKDTGNNSSRNEFPFDDGGSEIDGYPGNDDDDVEIKYQPFSDLRDPQTSDVKLQELRVALHKIPEHTLGSLVRRKVTGKNSKIKNTKSGKQKKCLESQTKTRRVSKRKTAGKNFGLDIESDKKVPNKTRKVKREREPLKNENDSPTDAQENKESDIKTAPKRKRQKKVKTENTKLYECRICLEMFPSEKLLTAHRRIHKIPKPDNPADPYTCEICGKVSANFAYHKRHSKYTHSYKSHKIPCHICGKIFKESYLNVHVRTVHSGEEEREKQKVECKICGKILPKYTLKVHMKIHSENREKFICTYCGNVYWKKENYNRHLLSHNQDAASPFSCKVCQKRFYGKYALERHERRHNKDNSKKPFSCDQCEKSFNENYMLVRHKVTHQEERPFKCDICGKGFKSSEYLTMHKKGSHEKTRKVNTFPCLTCGAKYRSKIKLDTHVASHNTTTDEHRNDNENTELETSIVTDETVVEISNIITDETVVGF